MGRSGFRATREGGVELSAWVEEEAQRGTIVGPLASFCCIFVLTFVFLSPFSSFLFL